MHDERTMRWLERRSGFVPTTSFIDPRRYAVERLSDARAREFIKRHHYLTSFPAATGGRYQALVFERIPPEHFPKIPPAYE